MSEINQINSQFPWWDFVECNMPSNITVPRTPSSLALNSLGGISLNATRKSTWIMLAHKENNTLNSLGGISLNATQGFLDAYQRGDTRTLNSLGGISLNATNDAKFGPFQSKIPLNSLGGISLNATYPFQT